jgi:FkbM family methyltransferase
MPHYSFIEIGTSDFDTLLQTATEDQRGLSIDPLQLYLDRLPTKPLVTKVCAAISNACGSLDLFYIEPATIQRLALPDWVRGCNSVGKPHATVVKSLRSLGLDPDAIIRQQTVPMKNIETLFTEHEVTSVDFLKIDTEGHDCVILNNYIDYCERHPSLFASKILFETNVLSSVADQEAVISRLKSNEYRLRSRGHDTVLVRGKRRVVVIADIGWSIGRIHYDLQTALAPEYMFTFHAANHFYMHKFLSDFHDADLCLTTFNHYNDMKRMFPKEADRKKIAIVCHGFKEFDVNPPTDLIPSFTYGVTSHVLSPRFAVPHHVVLTGAKPDEFAYAERDGVIRSLGWCGACNVAYKQSSWGHDIAKQTQLPISYAETLSYDALKDWYKTIDVLLVTAGPEVWKETGPLPPFEAICSGVLVIGVPTGNFSLLPGPKFHTVEEAVKIVKELKADPGRVKTLAKEQYDCVMAKWTYDTTKETWRTMFDAVIHSSN